MLSDLKSYDSDSESQLNEGDETWINTRSTLNPFFGGGLTETAASNYRDGRGTFTGFAVSGKRGSASEKKLLLS